MGNLLHQKRVELTSKLKIGLTDLYNLFHNKNLNFDVSLQEEIEELRQLHSDIDNEIGNILGWNDLSLNHNFYDLDILPESDRTRYTVHPPVRREILKRLLILNKSIYSEEQNKALSLLKKKAPKKTIDSNVNDLFSNF
ncbi:hypothetical protein [Sphingobacterium sp. T2]|uniref:hypothetical protein n=1 Tax=Sphingobacterium sp. T2 TaxID=1590596 RepID=UPI0012E0334C|nr:hypothetical protein [Sphingobacterium sp. T2]